MNLGVRHALSRPLLCYCKAMGATLRGLGTGLQGGQGQMGAARGRTTRRTRPLASKTLRRVTPPPPRAGRVAYVVNRMMPHDAKGGRMRRSLLVFLTLLGLSACATLVTGRPEYQQVLVTQRYEAAYLRAQAVAVGLGLQIVRTQDQAHIFTAKRPASGEEVTITIAPSGMGCLITFQGAPPHDVTDLVRAYQRTPS